MVDEVSKNDKPSSDFIKCKNKQKEDRVSVKEVQFRAKRVGKKY